VADNDAMNADDVRNLLAPHKRRLADEYGVASLLLFGSTARGEAGEESDVDLLVEFNRPTGYFGLVVLQQYLSVLLHREVDLGTRRALKPRVRERVERELTRVA
jgi:predicted nucleotidyltransferase